MNSIPLSIVIRMLRIALGYGSRTEIITRLLNSTDPDVAIIARSLAVSGYLDAANGTIVVHPER